LGWNEFFAPAFAAFEERGFVPGRVALEHKHAYVLLTTEGEVVGEVSGRLLNTSQRASLPAVGDWVVFERRARGSRATIHGVLPRRTVFSRRAAGEREQEQVVAANVDTVFLVAGLDVDFNPRRTERYLALARGSGARPVVVLNKADTCAEVEVRTAAIRSVAGDAAVHAISAVDGRGLEALHPYLGRGRTVALLGSSGVGKSTLANRFLGEDRQVVGTVKEDDGRGRHTTTHRELILLPDGTLLVDTPGMRELQLWSSARDGLQAVFPEILELAASCRFRDCHHAQEPGCAVRAAVARGELPPERWASFEKLRAELEALEAKVSGTTRRATRVRGRRIMRG
jgi:ribosome biogenesis GTPase